MPEVLTSAQKMYTVMGKEPALEMDGAKEAVDVENLSHLMINSNEIILLRK